MVMAPLSGVVLATVKPISAGAGAGLYGTTQQIANAAGVAAIGAVFFAIEATRAVCSLYAVRVFDHHLRRIFVVDAARASMMETTGQQLCKKIAVKWLNFDRALALATNRRSNPGDRQHTLFLFCAAATICSWWA